MPLIDPFSQLTRRKVGEHWHTLVETRPTYQGKLPTNAKPLVAIAQLSDPHVCDAQSPLRASYFDRLSDPHNATSRYLPGPLGGYRAQEALTTQVLHSMLQTLQQIEIGPRSNLPVSLLLLTGDLADNMQQNELRWVANLLRGGPLLPNSGSELIWQGPGSTQHYSPHYWNPDATPEGEPLDAPRARYGFPTIPELWSLATRGFQAAGVKMPWVAVHGNHDGLIQGTIAASAETNQLAVGNEFPSDFRSQNEALEFLGRFGPNGPASWPTREQQLFTPTSADAARVLASPNTWSELGLTSSAKKYWQLEIAGLAIIGLDTCNPFGGWDGSIDVVQYEWLEDVLRKNASRRVILVSHHPQHRLENDWGGSEGVQRVTGSAILDLLNSHGKVIAWIAGHTHRNHVSRLANPNGPGILSIETASLIDWPQQGRILEIFESPDRDLYLSSTTYNHLGDVSPVSESSQQLEIPDGDENGQLGWLAGLSRQLAANDWQRQSGGYSVTTLEGESRMRNFVAQL